MAGSFTQVDLSLLPFPGVVESLDFETIFTEMLADLQSRDPAFTALVESDPAFKVLEAAAYRELIIRQRVNDAAKSVMLAFAIGTDLDQIAANYNVSRLLIEAGDPDALPPTEDVYESDEELRRRVLLSLEGYTTAGSIGAYIFHSLSASGDCLDVSVASPVITPGTVNVAVLSRTGDGTAPTETIDAVVAALNDDIVRPLCDTVVVEGATIVEYAIDATLDVYPGSGQQLILDAAQAAAEAYAEKMHRLGLDITLSGVFAALHQPGVQKVNLIEPATDVVIAWNQASYCTGITLAIGDVDE